MGVTVESEEDCGVDPAVAEWFLQIEEPLMQFARDYGLTVAKYPKDTPTWDFRFTHPIGGLASVGLRKDSDTQICVHGFWRMLDYDSGSMWQKMIQGGPPSGLDTIPRQLRATFETVLSWKTEDLPLIFTDNQERWHRYQTKEEFIKSENRYPIPRIAE